MNTKKLVDGAEVYFRDHYEKIVDFDFVTKPTIWICDHENPASRLCRFCERGPSETVTFRLKAHAGPELLGSKTIRTKNECDECNQRFGMGIETHLGNRLAFVRSVTQVKGKNGAPSYENPSRSMKIAHPGGKQTITLTDKSLFEKAVASNGAAFSFELPADAMSMKHVPSEAFKALVKIACSVCPLTELHACRTAIRWIMTGSRPYISNNLVVRTFTSGPGDAFTSKVVLLRRKQPSQEPYLWCILQVLNHSFQFFVPFIPSDTAILKVAGTISVPVWPYRPDNIPLHPPHDVFDYWKEDWSSTEEEQTSIKAGFHVQNASIVNGPTITEPTDGDCSR